MSEGDQPVQPVPGPIPGIRPPAPVSLDTNAAENWRYFKLKWQNYSVITNLEKQNRQYQVALLLHVLGDEALRIYNGFTFDTAEENRTVKEILDKFDEFAIGELNETYERYKFSNRSQNEGETFESFLSALRTLIKSCKYCQNCIDSLLRDRIVLGIRDASTQKLLLRERQLTLKKTVDICKSFETAATQEKAYRPEVVNKVRTHNYGKPHKTTLSTNYKQDANRSIRCKFCGTEHIPMKEKCPAWGKVCTSCNKPNHFAKVCHTCKSKPQGAYAMHSHRTSNKNKQIPV